MNPIQVPAEWDDNGIILFEEFCLHPHTAAHCPRLAPLWPRSANGRLFTTVAELRRFLRPTVANLRGAGSRG
jgi:hypothetical protein